MNTLYLAKVTSVALERVAEILEKEKPISTAKALRKAGKEIETALRNPKARKFSIDDFSTALLKKLQ